MQKALGRYLPKTAANGTIIRFSFYYVNTEKYVALPRDSIEETTPNPTTNVKDICARQGSFTNHLGKSKKYSLPLYTPRD